MIWHKTPFLFWLYAQLTADAPVLFPAVQLMFLEGLKASLPPPITWVQKRIHSWIVEHLDAQIAMASLLCDLNVSFVGQIVLEAQHEEISSIINLPQLLEEQ